jgi:hypothetical protein
VRAVLPAPVLRAVVLGVALAVSVVAVLTVVLLVAAALDVRAGAATGLVATVIFAFAVPVARPRLDRLADRVAFGRDGDPYAVMNRYVRQVAEVLAIDDVLPHLARTAAATVPGSRGEIDLELRDGSRQRQTWGPGGGVRHDLDVPLQHGGDRVGRLAVEVVSERPSPVDRRMLERLAAPAGLALANVRLTLELRRRLAQEMALAEQVRQSRQRLLDAADVERGRFAAAVAERVERPLRRAAAALDGAGQGGERQDAHGGGVALGPGGSPVDARGGAPDVAAARELVQQALDTLRDVASGVFPAALTERGTAAALEAHADRRGLRTAITTQGLPRYPAPVEAAAYFCAVALLDEPAPAQPTTVRLRCDDGSVHVGATGPARSREATLQLVRDRVEAMGGALDEWPDPAGGWVTSFELPLTDPTVEDPSDEGVPG